MNPYQHFGLKRPPFEATPDPRVFCAAAPHSETLATLEYAVYAKKPCTVVIGESGTGKTLLARIIAATASTQASVLWLHGLGQPEAVTELSVFRAGTLTGSAPREAPKQAVLGDWLRAPPRFSRSPLLIVDSAEELCERAWRDILALLSRDHEFPEPVKLVLFGPPGLLRQLAAPEMVRLRRRIFRTCVLRPLKHSELGQYVERRLSAAGGSNTHIFTTPALNQIYRLSKGIPGLINQVCDNAMLEAISEGKTQVSAAHVLSATQALTGAQALPTPLWTRSLLPGDYDVPALPPTARPEYDTSAPPPPPPATTIEPAYDLPDIPPPSSPPVGGRQTHIEQRLRQLESRMGDALTKVRQITTPPRGTPAEDISPPPAEEITADECEVVTAAET